MNDVIVIGAGASGLMAAGVAAGRGARVTLLDKNDRPGRKLMITGKGRCNLTNDCENIEQFLANVPRNPRFLYSSVSRFGPRDTMSFFEGLGVKLKVERGRRVFPESDRASDIVDALVRFAKDSGCRFEKGRAARIETDKGAVDAVILESGAKLPASSVILCTGGKSYPLTGSTGDGYRIAMAAGHKITKISPSLVPIVTEEPWVPECQGLSLRNVEIKVLDGASGKVMCSEPGEMLFTHFGLSGPLILSASAHIRDPEPGRYRIMIDLKPGLTLEKLENRLQRDFLKYGNRDFANSLSDLLPAKLIPAVVALSDIPRDLKTNQITKQMRYGFAELLKGLTCTVKSFRSIDEAIITSGGIDVSEINPKTMESKLVKNLYFAGEIIDCDAYTGGFNLQIAFSTGHAAGNSVQAD